MRIGIDLDNTIIFYDHAFVKSAAERGLVPANFTGTKQQVRDHIRTLKDGETKWQELQGYVYGKGLAHASLFDGVEDFLKSCAAHDVFIISHKTEFGHFDPDKVNLRDAAKSWLAAHGIRTKGLSFHSTRKEKVDAIANLNLDWFIDDLVEVYEEPHFPASVQKILFHTAPAPAPAGHWTVCGSWRDIKEKVFA